MPTSKTSTPPSLSLFPKAMALKAFPVNAPTALENLGLLVDNMWYYAGDRSTDFSWYTKRGLLATIYTSTGIYGVLTVCSTCPRGRPTHTHIHTLCKFGARGESVT